MVMQQYGVQDLHVQARVSGFALDKDGVQITFTNGQHLRSRHVLLAVGNSEHANRPSWHHKVRSGSIRHIFEDGMNLTPDRWPERVAVVGGGISGAQAALRFAEAGRRVTLVTRHALRKHQFDSDPGWVGPKSMTRFSKTADPAVRRQMISKARHTGSVTPDIHRRIRRTIDKGQLELVRSEVHSARMVRGGIRLHVQDGTLEVDRVLLATGFASRRPGGKLVDNLIEAQSLPCAGCGYPIVDRHLRWHPRVFVTGPLAELGPVARNIIGARRAAERIVPIASHR